MVPRVVPKCILLESTYSELSNALSNVFISQKLTEIQLFKVRYNYPLQVNFLTSMIFSKIPMFLGYRVWLEIERSEPRFLISKRELEFSAGAQ